MASKDLLQEYREKRDFSQTEEPAGSERPRFEGRPMTVIEASGRTVEISRPDEVLFPDDGITKLDLAEYYLRIAETMPPFVRNRPVSMHRFPDGITGEDFFHKDTPDYFPDRIERCRVDKKEGGTVAHAVCNDAATGSSPICCATSTPGRPCRRTRWGRDRQRPLRPRWIGRRSKTGISIRVSTRSATFFGVWVRSATLGRT